MKRKSSFILAALALAFCFSGCAQIKGLLNKGGLSSSEESSIESNIEDSSVEDSSIESSIEDSSVEDSSSEDSSIEDSSIEDSSSEDSSIEDSSSEDSSSEDSSSEESSVEDSSSEESSSEEEEEEPVKYTYTAFTPSEMRTCETAFGEIIPFLPNNEYYLEEYTDEYTGYSGINFYTYGNTDAEYLAYRAQYADYTLMETYEDEDGDTWYCYEKGDLYVEMSYYLGKVGYCVDVYVVLVTDDGDDDGGAYLYYDFTANEKALFMQYFGEVIPFLPNDYYFLEEDYDEYYMEDCLYYGVDDVTEMGFELYLGMYSQYDYEGTWEDMEGDTWYVYTNDNVWVEMCYFYYDGVSCMDVYIFSMLSDDDDDIGGGDIGGGDIGGGNDYGDVEMLLNDGKGLPTDADGVYDVDFTKATYVKDVTDQGYYLDGCPTTGDIKVLVIPVEFSDVTAASKGYSLDKINTAFNGASGTTDYFSVKEYYAISSYGQLNLDFVVLDSWFRPAKNSSYYAQATIDYYGDEILAGDQMIMDEALAYLESRMDLSQFDSDNNKIIDAVVMINTLDIDADSDFQWAYRYWNIYTDGEGDFFEYDKVSANDYLWASYQFLLETYDYDGEVYYDDDTMNTYTFIHEFAHILGADDYYDTAYVGSPLGGYDIMDSMTGDHNGYSKFNYGWLTSSRLVVAEDSITLNLEAFAESGDSILIANNWDDDLGAYQEYFLVVYYTNDGLNGGEYGYFEDEGILVYHINASLYKEVYEGETYYDVYNNNTDASDEYGTVENLIEYVTTRSGDYVYGIGDSLSANVQTDAGEKVAYTFTVDALTATQATLTFVKNN